MKPYVLGGMRQTREDDGTLPRTMETSIGLDLKTEVRPGLVLDLTLNTDFAQVEVDDEQVNLTRFGLFFPEKRDFFLENSGIFDFGVQGNPFEPPQFQMFFSRKIGIEEDEDEVVPILGGGRLTGRLGGQTVGLLTVVTDEVKDLVPREVFSVVRVKRDVGGNNYLGLMATDRRSSEGQNTVLGADGSFYLTPSTNVQGWLAHTFTQGEGGDDLVFGVSGVWSTDQWEVFTRYVMVGPETEAQSGFVQRTDLRRSDLFLRRSFRPEGLSIESWTSIWAGMSYRTRRDNAGLVRRPHHPDGVRIWRSIHDLLPGRRESARRGVRPGRHPPCSGQGPTMERRPWSCSPPAPRVRWSWMATSGQGTFTAEPWSRWGALSV